MHSRSIQLPGPVFLVPTKNTHLEIQQLGQLFSDVPANVDQVVADLSRPERIAAILGSRKSKPSLTLYPGRYKVVLYPNSPGGSRPRSYNIGHIGPSGLDGYRNVAGRCLRVRAERWQLAVSPGSTPHWAQAFFTELQAEWNKLLATGAETPEVAARRKLLDRLDRMIDAEEALVVQKETTEPLPFRRVRATGEQREGTESLYVLELADTDASTPEEGAYVQVKGEPSPRGRVTKVEGRSVTVTFEETVDHNALGEDGDLEVVPNTTVTRVQRETVADLWNNEARNPHLLDVVADRQVRPLYPGSAVPTESLNDEQLEAFSKGLTVEDALLVIGPPGTGKTRTIRQIAEQVALAGERVLITSHTHRAVDNVLGELPPSLVVVRAGQSEKVEADGQPYLLDRQAPAVCDQAQAHADSTLQTYDGLGDASSWTTVLGKRLDSLQAQREQAATARQRLEAVVDSIAGPLQTTTGALWEQLQRLHATRTRLQKRTARRTRLVEQVEQRSPLPGLRTWYRMRAGWHRRLLTACHTKSATLDSSIVRAAQQVADARKHDDVRLRDDPGVKAARRAAAEAVGARLRAQNDAREAAYAACQTLRPIHSPPVTLPPLPSTTVAGDDVQRMLSALHDRLTDLLPLLVRRRQLLNDWRSTIVESSDKVRNEILERADVIAATCVGASTTKVLDEVDVDVALVDEAGQINLPTLLIPWSRARRAILVGDHNQLPPFLDTDLEKWGRTVDEPEVADLLAKSGFEMLATTLPDSHVVLLREQLRMAEPIADFVSRQFYGGKLLTAVDYASDTRLFTGPLAFVDTTQLGNRRFEERQKAGEAWGLPGCTNHAEAKLLIELALYYHQAAVEWAVILPYRAQVDLIRNRLYRSLGDSQRVRNNVGTVDSFQGGERDVLLFGFTRSNPPRRDGHCNVGFLRELRRSNVAFSRAKHQLVLVGDLSTLVNADDAGFQKMARALRDYVARQGSHHHYREVEASLSNLRTAH